MEYFIIDEGVKAVMESLDDIISRENSDWVKDLLKNFQKGKKDVTILAKGCPTGRGKYYNTKKELIHKLYDCCVCKGLITYEEILREEME